LYIVDNIDSLSEAIIIGLTERNRHIIVSQYVYAYNDTLETQQVFTHSHVSLTKKKTFFFGRKI